MIHTRAEAPELETAEADSAAPLDLHAVESARSETRGAISRSSVIAASKIVSWGLAFVMTVMLPRYLGATGFGRLYLAMSLTGIMTVLVEFGLNSLVTREVSRRKENILHYVVNAAVLKALLWLVGCVVLAVTVGIAGYPRETQAAAAMLALSVLFTAEGTLLLAVLQADDRMRWIAWSTLAEKVVYVALGVSVLLLGFGVIAVATVILIGSMAGFALDMWWLRTLARQTDVRSGWRGLEVRQLLVTAVPFFSVLFFGAIYFRVDVVILSLLSNDTAVGHYGAAYRLFQTTYVLPEAFLFALFPLFCRLSAGRHDVLATSAQKGLDVLLLIGLPIAVGMGVLADEIVVALYGAGGFAASVPVLRILSVAIVLMYANGVFVHLLIATERQKRLAMTAAAAAALNVTLNFLLIPVIGALGCAIATVATEALVIGLNFSFLSKSVTGELRFRTVGKALVAAGSMGVVLWLLGGQPLYVLVPLGVVTYTVAIVLLRAVPREDWAMMKAAVLGREAT